jgi:Membrane-fusion protein
MKIVWKILKTLIVLAIIAGLGYYGYTYYQKMKVEETVAAPTYTRAQIMRGNLQKTVTGTGSLSISEQKKVTLDFDVQLDEALVKAGEAVGSGMPLATVNQDSLKTAIDTLNTEINDLDTSMATLGTSYSNTAYIKSPIEGRVKEIYGEKGDLTQETVAENGGLVLLSVDGLMEVTIETSDLKVGESVRVTEDRFTYAGSVETVTGGKATITFPDTRTLPDAQVKVSRDGTDLGEGNAQIHLPYICSTAVDGHIANINAVINGQIFKNGTLMYITNIPQTDEYKAHMKQRNEKIAILNAAKEIQRTGMVVSPVDGIINTISAGLLTAKTEIASIYVGEKMQMVISVDELDINGLKVGQEVQVAMDSVQEKAYTGTVSYISQIGTASSGVTTYSVTLDVLADALLKMGMNGTATIVVEEVNDVLLVPISALYSMRGRQYVWLYTEAETENGAPGIMTFVETGFSNDSFAEVTSGLKEGDAVMIVRSGTEGGNNMGTMFFGAGGGGMTTIAMPVDSIPMQRPSNGGGGGNWGSGGQRPGN